MEKIRIRMKKCFILRNIKKYEFFAGTSVRLWNFVVNKITKFFV